MRIVVSGDGSVLRDVTFDSGTITIGSDSGSQVHLPDLQVDLEHARLLIVPGGHWSLEAAHPDAVTVVNGRRLDKRCPIYNGDEIQIGGFLLKVAVDGKFDLGATGRTSLDDLARIKEFPLPRHGEAKQYDEPIAMQARVHRAIAALSQDLAACGDAEVLIGRVLDYLIETFDARMAWFGFRRQPRGDLEFMEGRNSDGTPGQDPPLLPTLEYRSLDRGQSLRLRRLEDGASAISTPLQGRRGRFGLLYAESRKTADRFRGHQLDRLFLIGTHVAARLESLLLGVSQPPRPAAADELAFLRDVQRRLDPKSVPPWAGFQVGIYSRPGADRGGDVYDLMTMPNEMASVFIGHVSGDATRTAMAIAEVHAAFRIAGLHGDPPHTLMRELNWLLHSARGECGLAAASAVMNPKSGAMEFSAAGQLGAVLIDAKGTPRTLIESPCPRLGTAKSMETPRQNLRLSSGEMLVLFTPGCSTVMDEQGASLTEQRLVNAICDGFGLGPADLLQELQGELAGFFKKGRQPDDITVMLIQRA